MYIDAIITLKRKATQPRYHCMHVISTKAKKNLTYKKRSITPRAPAAYILDTDFHNIGITFSTLNLHLVSLSHSSCT